jgi:anti-sigma regulatory factor (Ser/Thr protein kinase)
MAHADPSRGADDRGVLPDPLVPLDQRFDRDRLYSLRAAVGAHATGLGADEDAVFRVLIVAGELAANAIRHGGGSGRLRLWAEDGDLFCEVSDSGAGMRDPEATGIRTPRPDAAGGRGVWMVRQLSRRVDIDTGPAGTTVTAVLDIDTAGA